MAVTSNWNPLVSSGTRLAFPSTLFDIAVSFCRKNKDEMGQSKQVQDAPFERYVDLWMLALVLGRAQGKYDSNAQLKEFIGGEIFQGDLARISIILSIAIAHEGLDTQLVSNPRLCMKIANGYVAGGLQDVLDALNSGGGKNIENLFRELASED